MAHAVPRAQELGRTSRSGNIRPQDTISQSAMGSPDLADAIADVSEGYCPLCHVALIAHCGRACCPCGGCSYRLESERFEMTTCELHPAVRYEHWPMDASSSVGQPV
jgi:hypothetical protein